MTALIRSTSVAVVQQALDDRFETHVAQMRFDAEVAKSGMHELGELHTYAEFTAWKTLSEVQKLKKLQDDEHPMTPAQLHAYQIRGEQFLDHLGQITGRAGKQILLDIVEAPVQPDGERRVHLLRGLLK